MSLVVFTDRDGTLLDHDTYSHAEALPALKELADREIPLVLCSSKARAEMIPLWRELGLSAPIITENGGGIFAPAEHPLAQGDGWQDTGDGWRVIPLGLPIHEIRDRFALIKGRFGARGFGDMTPRDVAGLTGLSLSQAALALKREFSEPVLLWEPETQAKAFLDAAKWARLGVTRGGRFFHLLGGGGKGLAVERLAELYRAADPELTTMAVGDAPNDLSMFQQVDHAVLVARPDGSHAEMELEGLVRIPLAGPAGFNQAVADRLAGLGIL